MIDDQYSTYVVFSGHVKLLPSTATVPGQTVGSHGGENVQCRTNVYYSASHMRL